ncbi:MAG: dipeptide epimerase, partial [Deltaproteobacteria bacterium]|nr:dipeptide epimerase [Deltaproteobacteria bacterium]
MRATEILEVRAEPMTVELTEPFGIATGAQQVAENLLVAVRLGGGTVGYGEAAPFPAVNGETREDAARAVAGATPLLLGGDVRRFRYLSAAIAEATRAAPSARAALETALLDAFAREAGLSLLALFGGRETTLETDITIVTGGPAAAGAAAESAARDGFRTLK